MSDLIKARKGIFIPDITVEMFRNASLEAVEELLVSGEMQDIILPSAEPEIIRCNDCKHHILHPRMGVPWCRLLHSDMGDNQFCSYAERRGEEG